MGQGAKSPPDHVPRPEEKVIMRHEKLVRDLIPQIIEENGHEAVIKTLEDEEYLMALKEKLREEVEEYIESEDVEELADIMEVIHAFLEFHTLSYSEVENVRQKKLEERGGFSGKIFLIETSEG